MSNNAQKKSTDSIHVAYRPPPVIPPRGLTPSAMAIERGTDFTLYVLAIENLSNHFPGLQFTDECIKNLKLKLTETLKGDPDLYLEIKNFVSGMPLDAISQSAHPKRIKQLLLESLLNPEILNENSLRTDPTFRKTPVLNELIQNIQFYVRLCEISGNPLTARVALEQVIKQALLLKIDEFDRLLKLIESVDFKYLTDKTFCLNQKKNIQVIPLRASQMLTVKKPPESSTVIDRTDVALKAILVFKQYEQLSKPPVSEGGESYESLQRRVYEQQKHLEKFKKECVCLSVSLREALYEHISGSWTVFIKGDSSRLKRHTSFLDFISNL